MNELEKYNNQDIFNPEYLYHGSPYIMEKIEPREAKDSVNKENEYTQTIQPFIKPLGKHILDIKIREAQVKEARENETLNHNHW